MQSIAVSTGVTTYDADLRIQYTQDSLACAGACGATNVNLTTLKSLRNQLLNDMVPYTGQYAIEKDSINLTGVVYDPTLLEAKFNIFTNTYTTKPGGVVTPKPFYYRAPKTEAGADSDYFTDENKIDITIEPTGITLDRTLLNTILPADFTNLFQRSWAKSLIKYHPEFCKLNFAETTLFSSYAWLDSVQACTTYAVANAQGYLTPLTSDPYFKNNFVPADKTAMQQYLTSNVGPSVDLSRPSIWQIANANVVCATTVDYQKATCMAGAKRDGMDLALNKDTVWEQFKSIYLSYRNEMLMGYINSRTGINPQTGTAYLTRAEMDSLIRQGKQLVFAKNQDAATQNGYTWWAQANAANVDTAALRIAAANNVSQVTSTDKCAAQKPLWKAKLLQCEQFQKLLNKTTAADSLRVNTAGLSSCS